MRKPRSQRERQTREQRAWYIYDFANSAFASTVITLFLGPYLTSMAKAAAGPDGCVHPFGIPVEPRSWWGYMVALSVMTQVVSFAFDGNYRRLQREQEGAARGYGLYGRIAQRLLMFTLPRSAICWAARCS